MSWWRTRSVDSLAYSGYTVPEALKIPPAGDCLFHHAIAVDVMREFQGYNPDPEGGEPVETSILTLARLDTWLTVTVKGLDQPDGRGGIRQKWFNEVFFSLLPVATEQLLLSVREIVRRANPDELWSQFGDGASSEDPFANRSRSASIVVELPSMGDYRIVAEEGWFQRNISKVMGSVLDCFIGHFKKAGELSDPLRVSDSVVGDVDDERQFTGSLGGQLQGSEQRTPQQTPPSPSGLPLGSQPVSTQMDSPGMGRVSPSPIV